MWNELAQKPRSALAFIALVALMVRTLLGANFPHSGRATPPMYGDFEAQRHWLEITLNVPIQDWYRNTTDNDLLYWGLDYPPLTAYHSLLMGKVASKTHPELVELHKSRGHESPSGIRFMRLSVLLFDALVFFSAVLKLVPALYRSHTITQQIEQLFRSNSKDSTSSSAFSTLSESSTWVMFAAVAFVLLHPALILIDHGHFQYNCVCLGLVLWSVYHILKGRELLASFLFVCALCYKQMALYFAPAFFFMLAGRAWQQCGGSWPRFFSRILLLGLVVILSFLICFAPIIYTAAARPASGESPFQSAIVAVGHVLYRVFPFARGLFEDKVANFWCATSVVFRWKERFSSHSVLLVRAALGTTIVALLPSGINLFKQPTAASFILSLGTQALAFFLFSFQVHEKTILMPLAPLLLCYACGQRSMFFTAWLSNIAMFSMYPLLFRDGLVLPYCAFQIVFTLLAFRLARAPSEMWNVCCVISLSGCMVLHLASAFVPAPARYPDIHLLACAVYSFVHFALAFAGLHVLLYRLPQLNVVAEQVVSFSAAAVSDASASTSPAAVQPTPSRVLRSSTKKQQ